MKITKLTLKNFQSHSDTTLQFDPHVNCILGPSDSGKSSIVRSLVSLLFKEKFYLRNNSEHGLITVGFDDGTVITREKRIKDKQVSEKFILNGVVYRKIGKSLPEEFLKAMRIHEVILNDGSKLNLNVQGQHDGKFLLSTSEYSQGFRARVTSMAGSEVLDKASQEAAKDHRRVKSDLTRATDVDLHEANTRLSSMTDLSDKLGRLKKHTEDGVTMSKRIQDYTTVTTLQGELKRLSQVKPYDVHSLVSRLRQQLVNLEMLLLFRKLKENLKFDTKLTVDTKVFSDRVTNIITLNNTLSQIKTLKNVVMEKDHIKDLIMMKTNVHTGLNTEYNTFMDSLTRCPLCLK